jgi:hypothetical protein
MKEMLLITLILAGISEIQAVAQDTIYYNASWQITTAEKVITSSRSFSNFKIE